MYCNLDLNTLGLIICLYVRNFYQYHYFLLARYSKKLDTTKPNQYDILLSSVVSKIYHFIEK